MSCDTKPPVLSGFAYSEHAGISFISTFGEFESWQVFFHPPGHDDMLDYTE